MKIPKLVADLIAAQNNFDNEAFANYFSNNATVFDEAKTHQGKKEIRQWNADTSAEYKTVLDPISYEEKGDKGVLATKVSGTFEGSPIVVKYNFEFSGGLIQSLKITG